MRAAVLLACVTVAAMLVACGGDDTTTTSRTVSAGSPQAGRTVVAYTNIPQIDQALNNAIAGDEIELARITGYQQVACAETSEGPEAPPICRQPDESVGQAVEVFPYSRCEVTWVRPEQVPDVYQEAFDREGLELYAAYTPSAFATRYGTEYVAVVVDSDGNGVAIHTREGRVVFLEDDCDNLPALVAPERAANFIKQPEAPPTG